MCTEINRLLLEMSASHMLTLGRCNSSRFDHKSERRMNCSIILLADELTSLSKNTIYKNKQETLQSELKLGMKNLGVEHILWNVKLFLSFISVTDTKTKHRHLKWWTQWRYISPRSATKTDISSKFNQMKTHFYLSTTEQDFNPAHLIHLWVTSKGEPRRDDTRTLWRIPKSLLSCHKGCYKPI